MNSELYEMRDPRFARLIHRDAGLRRIATGFEWVEGPVWFPAFRMLLFSDIPSQRMMRWTPDGTCAVFRDPSGYSNGNTRDPQGRLLTCQHGTRSVTRTEADGTVVTLASESGGKRLNSPNDLVVKSDGSIWFTDPTYGIDSDLEGYAARPEQPGSHVYRIPPGGGKAVPVITGFVQPNGLAFSPDESLLYVAESGGSHDSSAPPVIRVFPVVGDSLGPEREFARIEDGRPDGIRCDANGNLWSSARDGVSVFAPDGTLLGKILVPETVSNLCFGGERGIRLFITATTSVYMIAVNARAAGWPAPASNRRGNG
ncbi:SMP-30/gluconolactonase/LRE family protein [Paracoccus pacificus]|uniref:SMP-30/gluconolactonase/LRE family protein n=1 Tax=Paracoccus pacificus TaxID=1463598 RepID=A0ABW4R293_9RHOB